jgi:sigma-E factor negative regulatory protein RseB
MPVRLVRWLAPLCLLAAQLPGIACAADGAPVAAAPADARGWLARIRAAAIGRNYQGTMVFTTGSTVSSSRVAHFCVDDQIFERIEALDGQQRQVYRYNDLVHTVWPQAGLAVVERRQASSGLPSATQSIEPRALDQYQLQPEGRDRVAGRVAFVLLLRPRDELRFAQRVWADHETGLILRSDVVGHAQDVLESSAFSEVEIGVRAQPETVLQPIRQLERLRVLRPTQTATQLESQGWTLTQAVPGFELTSCIRRPVDLHAPQQQGAGAKAEVTQAVYSDGLTHVSLFIEPLDPARHRREIQARFGATHSLAGRRGAYWVTAMGDVPPITLRRFFDALERRP